MSDKARWYEKNVHGYEMQTGKFEQHFRDLGFTGTIEIVEDDEGTGGTLDIHNRPGMLRLLTSLKLVL